MITDGEVFTVLTGGQVLTIIVMMENCAMEVRDWLVENKLIHNDGKTLISLIGTPQQLKKVQIGTIRIG